MNWLPKSGTKQSNRGNEEKRTEGQREGRSPSRLDEERNPLSSGRMRRNCRKVFKVYKLEQSMIESSSDASVIWKNLPWKKFQKKLFRLQQHVYKAIQVGNKRKATSLQRLILKSTAARAMAVRQVTQLNAGKKTSGVDGKASLKGCGFDLM